MTELTFLVELLLNHKLPKATKDLVAQRIREVEEGLILRPSPPPRVAPSPQAAQAPSTQAILDRNPDLVQPAAVGQTPAAVAALNSRQEAINASLNGKVDKAAGRPRKF